MDKPVESRKHGLAERQKSNQNPHLSDEQLLLALDGELSDKESAHVELHVESCWSCRSRRQQIEKAIRDVVEYRDHLIHPYLSISTGGRSMFDTRLEQLAVSTGRPPLWKRLLQARWVFWAITQIEVPRYVWGGALVVTVLALFLFTSLWHVPRVSASQLLENAQLSEVRALQLIARPVVYQRLRIQVGSQVVTRTIYRDPVGKRHADHLEVVEGGSEKLSSKVSLQSRRQDQPSPEQTADTEFQRSFFAAHLSWEDPLSPNNYSTWYKSLDERIDEITTGAENFITLKTTTSEGPIAEGRITVRSADFHPVAEDLRLQDGRRVEIHELAWDVLPMEAIIGAIFEPEPTLSDIVGKRPGSVALQPSVVTDSELAEAELRARVAIHAEKADLGEPIELDRDIPKSGQGLVVVRGIVSTSQRKNDLISVLEGIPHVELRLHSIEEGQSQQDQVPRDKWQDPTSQIAQGAVAQADGVAIENIGTTRNESTAIVVAGWPAFEQRLEERFPIAEDRTAFVNETVELMQNALAQAWALRRLGNRYTPDMVAELNSESQETLELLIRDHVLVLRQDVDELGVKISALVSPTFVTSVPESASDTPLSTQMKAGDWRGNVMGVFTAAQKVNDNGSALLAESSETLLDPQTVVRELKQALATLGAQLPTLYQQVSGPFLSEPKNIGR